MTNMASLMFLQVDSASVLGVPLQILKTYSLISFRSLLRSHFPKVASLTTCVK